MKYQRKNFAAIVVGGGKKIMVFGGGGDRNSIPESNRSIEMFDPRTEKWSVVPNV